MANPSVLECYLQNRQAQQAASDEGPRHRTVRFRSPAQGVQVNATQWINAGFLQVVGYRVLTVALTGRKRTDNTATYTVIPVRFQISLLQYGSLKVISSGLVSSPFAVARFRWEDVADLISVDVALTGTPAAANTSASSAIDLSIEAAT